MAAFVFVLFLAAAGCYFNEGSPPSFEKHSRAKNLIYTAVYTEPNMEPNTDPNTDLDTDQDTDLDTDQDADPNADFTALLAYFVVLVPQYIQYARILGAYTAVYTEPNTEQ